MALTKVKNDLLPLRAGVLRITPLNAAGVPMSEKAYTTNRAFVTSTQVTTARNVETVPNGNGQDLEIPLDETYNLAVSCNVFDPKLHAIIAGIDKVVTAKPVLLDTTIVPTKASGGLGVGAEYAFTNAKEYPVAGEDGKFYIEVKDAYGNILNDVGKEGSVTAESFKYDDSAHRLSFSSDYENQAMSVAYYIAGTGDGYEAPSIIKTRQYLIEIMGEMQSAASHEHIRYYARITRGSVSGDLPSVTTQKQATSTITYNFKSDPVPAGVSPFYQSFNTIEEAKAAE